MITASSSVPVLPAQDDSYFWVPDHGRQLLVHSWALQELARIDAVNDRGQPLAPLYLNGDHHRVEVLFRLQTSGYGVRVRIPIGNDGGDYIGLAYTLADRILELAPIPKFLGPPHRGLTTYYAPDY